MKRKCLVDVGLTAVVINIKLRISIEAHVHDCPNKFFKKLINAKENIAENTNGEKNKQANSEEFTNVISICMEFNDFLFTDKINIIKITGAGLCCYKNKHGVLLLQLFAAVVSAPPLASAPPSPCGSSVDFFQQNCAPLC